MHVIASMPRHICPPTDAPIHSANYILIAQYNKYYNDGTLLTKDLYIVH